MSTAVELAQYPMILISEGHLKALIPNQYQINRHTPFTSETPSVLHDSVA